MGMPVLFVMYGRGQNEVIVICVRGRGLRGWGVSRFPVLMGPNMWLCVMWRGL